MRELHPLAIYVHCPTHNLNLVLQDAAELPSIRSAVTAITELINYIRVSGIRSDVLEKHIKVTNGMHVYSNYSAVITQ